MPGPPPSPNARRRNARPEWRRLPAEGRPGDPPAWPLPAYTGEEPEDAAAEAALWAELWASPQAVAWESLGWTRVVARYTRLTIKAEAPYASASIQSEVRQLEDRLGLNPMAMKRLCWEIVGHVEPEPVPPGVADLEAFRERLA